MTKVSFTQRRIINVLSDSRRPRSSHGLANELQITRSGALRALESLRRRGLVWIRQSGSYDLTAEGLGVALDIALEAK